MRTLLLAPHADDETLFAAYICQRDRPHILCCFDQGRSTEFMYACAALGCASSTILTNPGELEAHLGLYATGGIQRVWAPAIEDEGHEDHNFIGELAVEIFGRRVRHYLTYAPRGKRSTGGLEVIPKPWMIASKLRALGCYQSQIEEESTRPWFFDLLDLREWTLDEI